MSVILVVRVRMAHKYATMHKHLYIEVNPFEYERKVITVLELEVLNLNVPYRRPIQSIFWVDVCRHVFRASGSV